MRLCCFYFFKCVYFLAEIVKITYYGHCRLMYDMHFFSFLFFDVTKGRGIHVLGTGIGAGADVFR